MHDGRFKSLKEVIDHYCDHIEISATTDLFLHKKINLSKNERVELVSFLHTLNDTSFIFNKTSLPQLIRTIMVTYFFSTLLFSINFCIGQQNPAITSWLQNTTTTGTIKEITLQYQITF